MTKKIILFTAAGGIALAASALALPCWAQEDAGEGIARGVMGVSRVMSVDGITRGIEIGITIGTGITTVTETGIMTGITRGIEIMSAGASTTATRVSVLVKRVLVSRSGVL